MMDLPSIRSLRALDAVARHESFSRAARALHVTQGAVSQRIRTLEEEVGASVFTRAPGQVSLTPAGRALLRATRQAFGILRAGLAEVEALAHPRRVTVSCSPSFAIRWLVPHLGDLRTVAPEVEVHVSANDAIVTPSAGSIDVCIRFGPGGYSGVDAEPLGEERVTPVCTPLYAERQGLTTPGDLSRCRLLHDDVLVDLPEHVGWAEWLDAAGVTTVDPAGTHFSHSHLALDAAASGQGVALARTSLVRHQLAQGQLVAPFAVALSSGLTYWIVTPRGAPPGGATKAFCDWLRSSLRAEAG